MWQWAIAVRREIRAKRLEIQPATDRAFTELQKGMPEATGSAIQDVLSMVANDLAPQGWALAGVIEGINKREYLSLANDAFDLVDMVVVMTIDNTYDTAQEVLPHVDRQLRPDTSLKVELDKISGPDVKTVIETRWTQFSHERSPFDDAAIETAFDHPTPVARALSLVNTLLTIKQAEFYDYDPWPKNKELLSFPADQFRLMIRNLERFIRT